MAGDWRMQGSAMRRRGGHPSNHRAGARVPDPVEVQRDAGRPDGTTKNEAFWDKAHRQEMEIGDVSDSWTEESERATHESLQHKRMRPEGRYFR